MASYKYSLDPVNIRHPRMKPTNCFICGERLTHAYKIHGSDSRCSFWLRLPTAEAILICGSEVCFNMVLLSEAEWMKQF